MKEKKLCINKYYNKKTNHEYNNSLIEFIYILNGMITNYY